MPFFKIILSTSHFSTFGSLLHWQGRATTPRFSTTCCLSKIATEHKVMESFQNHRMQKPIQQTLKKPSHSNFLLKGRKLAMQEKKQ
jgi:hypothetical protein